MNRIAQSLIAILMSVPCFSQTRDLNYYLGQAIQNSALLNQFRAQIASTGIDSQRTRALYKPRISVDANNGISPVTNGYGYDPILTNIQAFNDVLNVNKTFAGRNNLQSQYNSIRLTQDSLRNAANISEQELRRTVIAQYILAYGDLQQVQFNSEINGLLKKQDTLLRKLTQSNVYRQTDYLTFLVTLQQQELQLKQLRIQLQTDFGTLNYLCGIFDTSAASLAAPDITLLQLPNQLSSIFFERYVIDSQLLQNQVSMINYSYRPRLSVFANAGYVSSFMYDAYKNFGYGFGMTLTVPIYDGNQKNLQIRKIKLLQQSNTATGNFFKNQYGQQTAMLQQQLQTTEALLGDITAQVDYARELIGVNGKLLETGDAKISDFVIAINSYLNAKNLFTQNVISRMQIINQLNYWYK